MCVFVCLCVFMFVDVRMFSNAQYVFVCTYVCRYIMLICTCVRMFVCTSVLYVYQAVLLCVWKGMYVPLYVCMYPSMRTQYIHIHIQYMLTPWYVPT